MREEAEAEIAAAKAEKKAKFDEAKAKARKALEESKVKRLAEEEKKKAEILAKTANVPTVVPKEARKAEKKSIIEYKGHPAKLRGPALKLSSFNVD